MFGPGPGSGLVRNQMLENIWDAPDTTGLQKQISLTGFNPLKQKLL
jgi:hypothetical protein